MNVTRAPLSQRCAHHVLDVKNRAASTGGRAGGRRARLPTSKATEAERMTSVFSADRRNTSVISPKGY